MRKNGISFLLSLLVVALAVAVSPGAQTLYSDGPINGQTDAWTINEGFVVNDSFTIANNNSTITGLSFGAWLFAGDTLESAEVLISSEPFGGTIYYEQQVNFTQSGCFLNNYSFDVCTETASFSGPTLGSGTSWLSLMNAVSADGNPVYWDENSGPSMACEGDCAGSIPAEAFTILGTSSSTSGSVPEPSSLLLFSGAVLSAAGMVRRKRSKA